MRLNTIYPAVQGEGAQVGTPMVIVRLQGCGVGCPWCDTKETWDPDAGEELTHAAIADLVLAAADGWRTTWALVTGGEPADQPLEPLVRALHDVHVLAALETSGTATGHVGAPFDWICVSPKLGMPGGRNVLPEAVAGADELKFVVGRRHDVLIAKEFLEQFPHRPDVLVSLQPVSQSKAATTLAIEGCRANGWRLSVQLHKYLDLP